MGVHIAYSLAGQAAILDELQDLTVRRDYRSGKIGKTTENRRAVLQISTGEFPDDEWVSDDVAAVQRIREARHAPPQVIDPN